MSLFYELKRRNVLRVGAGYAVASWLLTQVAETVFPLFGFDDTPARIVVILLAIGFLPVTIFAWVFELTPEGLKKDSQVDPAHSIGPQTGKKLDRLIMVTLALALSYFAFDKFVLDPARDMSREESARQTGRTEARVEAYGEKSIAVLPFVNMSSDVEQEYLSDGISEELLNLLANIPELRVISRTSAFSYRDKNIKLAQVAEELDVAHILAGSVRRSGDKLRITAQLIEARSDTHLWSKTYDRQLDDIFAVQYGIAAAVVDQLKITLLGAATKVRDPVPAAYDLNLQARHFHRLFSREGIEQSISLYKQALAIDPDYATAWEGLAFNYIDQAGFGLVSFEAGYALAREAVEKALAIDPDFAPAYELLGQISMTQDNDRAQAARHFERALALDPANVSVISSAAELLKNLGQLDEAIVLREYLSARDPVNPVGYFNLGSYYRYAGRWDEAIAAFRTTLRLSPDFIAIHYFIGVSLLLKGEAAAALEAFAIEQDEAYRVKGQALALYALGRQEEHQASLAELSEHWGGKWPSEVAHVYGFTGAIDDAFQWLEKAAAEEAGAFYPADPFLSSLHDDPRWLPFLESIGSSPEQQEAISFNVALPE